MTVEDEARAFLRRFAHLTEARDAEAYCDLFLRDPAPLVTFSDGERAADWLDVRVRVGRDFERSFVDRVEIHDVATQEIADDVVVVAFGYDIRARDMWGTSAVAARQASLTLVRTKDGWRVAAAHFSAPR